jgi:hypothetical protein
MWDKAIVVANTCPPCTPVGTFTLNPSGCFSSGSYIPVTLVGKCAENAVNPRGFCHAYTRTINFAWVSFTGSSPDIVTRWEFTENGITSWIEYDPNGSPYGPWSFLIKKEHWPHFSFVDNQFYCEFGLGGCDCYPVCLPYPSGDFGYPPPTENYGFRRRLIDVMVNSCGDDQCPELPAWTVVDAPVNNCGQNPDPDGNIYPLGFFIDYAVCCVGV